MLRSISTPAPATPPRPGRRRHKVAITVSVLALVMLAAVPLAVRYAPYSWDIQESGRTGLTVDADGNYIALIHVCSVTITTLDVHGSKAVEDWPATDQEGSDWARYTTRWPLFGGVHEVDLADPGRRWNAPDQRIKLGVDGQQYSIGASDQDNGMATGPDASAAQLRALRPGHVLIGVDDTDDVRTVTRDEYDNEKCFGQYPGAGAPGRL